MHKYLTGQLGGSQQLGADIENNYIDLVIFLRDPQNLKSHEPDVDSIVRLCDTHNIPLATNLATAELLIHSLDRGDLDWRTNKYKILLPVLILALLLLTGCTQRSDVAEAYQLYETSDNYALTESSASAAPELLAENLCVGGTENSATDGIDAAFAQSAGVFSVEDEVVTYAQNIYQRMYPASTTKILTAYIALKYGNLDDVITVSNEAITSLMSGSSICGLKPGDSLTLDQALYGLMLCSGNDAANAIAEHISGSVEKFAELMNQEAAALGASQSHFVNAHGLPDENHYTTAYDLYLIFNAAVQNDHFVKLISTKKYDASYMDASGAPVNVTWFNTNGYLKGTFSMPENVTVIGGKTGTTEAAGSCLVLYSKNSSGKPYISVVLKGNSKRELYTLMTELLTNFSKE